MTMRRIVDRTTLFSLLVLALLLGTTARVSAQGAPKIKDSAARQINTLNKIKTEKSTIQNKIDSRLFLGILKQRNDPRLNPSGPSFAPLSDFRFIQPEADGRIALDIKIKKGLPLKPILSRLEQLGASVRSASRVYGAIRATLPMNQIETLAGEADVRHIGPALKGYTNRVNTSAGDVAHRAADARASFGVTGAGVKICVLSDGIDSLAASQASGDLPAVDVLPGAAGAGDEGTAMLEIVYDLAPGAQLGFAEAGPDEASFAQNIRDLRDVLNCDIIVDDIIYLDESPFQDNDVAESVNVVTADGALYFSSAGNEGNKDDGTSGTWEGNFVGNGTPAALAGGGVAHNFGDGGQSNLVTAGGAVTVLHWTDPFGASANDYDIYDMDGGLTTIFDSSAAVQDGTQDPVEIMGGSFNGERLVVLQFDGVDRMINLINFRGETENNTTGATRGHSATVNAFSTAAVDVATASGGPFTGGAANPTETFSSDGPRRIYFDNAGALLPGAPAGDFSATGGVVRQKPDIAAGDGVSTAAPGFDPFFGTSAAAPHAAAIAGLVMSAFPAMTPAQVRTALINSALDIEVAGVDRDSGAGIVMAFETLQANGATPQANLTLGTVTPTQIAGDGDAFVEPNEDWSLSVQLTNGGAAAATAISAVLSTTTPGVAILQGNSAYPDLAVAASGTNTTPYSFALLSSVPCGTTIHFQLTVTYTGGPSPQVFDLPAIVAAAAGTPQTFSFTGPPVPIPDGADLSGTLPGAPVSAPIVVAGFPQAIYDINVSIDGSACSATQGSTTVGLDHSFVNDLELTLISPNATSVKVIDNTDGSGNNFCQTVLDDNTPNPSIQTVVTANAPFTGTFKPNALLGAFAGQVGNGNWQLQAQDFFSQDTGNIRAFSLIITPAICDAPPASATVTATKTAASTGVAGSPIVYTITLHNTGNVTALDNAGHEFSDTLPTSVTFVSVTASSGTAAQAAGVVTWDGAIAPGASVTITVNATINAGLAAGTVISNQGTVATDVNRTGAPTGSVSTDDPGQPGGTDPTNVVVGGGIAEVPTLSTVGFAVLIALLALAGVVGLRRRRTT